MDIRQLNGRHAQRILAAALAATVIVGVLSAYAPRPAHAAGEAEAPVTIASLQKRVVALEKRLAKLEEQLASAEALEAINASGENAERLAALDKRVAAVERRDAPGRTARKGDDDAPRDDDILSVRAPFVVRGVSGAPLFRVDESTKRVGLPVVTVGDPAGARVIVGLIAPGQPSVQLLDAADSVPVRLSATGGLGHVMVVNKSDKIVARLGVDAAGAGYVRVAGPAGGAGAGLGADALGGRVVVANSATGFNTIALKNSADGGGVYVYPAGGGTPRASLYAEPDEGSVNVLNKSGQVVGWLQGRDSTGRMLLLNANGDTVVEAGTTTDNVGIVRTGPGTVGPAALVGSSVKSASSIQGRK